MITEVDGEAVGPDAFAPRDIVGQLATLGPDERPTHIVTPWRIDANGFSVDPDASDRIVLDFSPQAAPAPADAAPAVEPAPATDPVPAADPPPADGQGGAPADDIPLDDEPQAAKPDAAGRAAAGEEGRGPGVEDAADAAPAPAWRRRACRSARRPWRSPSATWARPTTGAAAPTRARAAASTRARTPSASTAPSLMKYAYEQLGVEDPARHLRPGQRRRRGAPQPAAGRRPDPLRPRRRRPPRRHVHRRRQVHPRAPHGRRGQDLEPRRPVLRRAVPRGPPGRRPASCRRACCRRPRRRTPRSWRPASPSPRRCPRPAARCRLRAASRPPPRPSSRRRRPPRPPPPTRLGARAACSPPSSRASRRPTPATFSSLRAVDPNAQAQPGAAAPGAVVPVDPTAAAHRAEPVSRRRRGPGGARAVALARGAEGRAAARAAGDGVAGRERRARTSPSATATRSASSRCASGSGTTGRSTPATPSKPELQIKWFIDQALAVKAKRIAEGNTSFETDPNQWGEWIADIERPAEEFRGRYQERLDEARGLHRQTCRPPPAGRRRRCRRRRGRRVAPSHRAPAAAGGLVLPVAPTQMAASNAGGKLHGSEFGVVDAEGAPRSDGVKIHAGYDLFANGGAPVRSMITGKVVEVRASRGETGPGLRRHGQGARAPTARSTCSATSTRACGPEQTVQAGQQVATVTNWRDGTAARAHGGVEELRRRLQRRQHARPAGRAGAGVRRAATARRRRRRGSRGGRGRARRGAAPAGGRPACRRSAPPRSRSRSAT